jgi:hypothetical protein
MQTHGETAGATMENKNDLSNLGAVVSVHGNVVDMHPAA